ncbi:antitoxin YezG family protein [Nocardiopsis alborubida]|nr:antitoxin YezG family protein [Nocardiopsis alborubida]
MRPFRRGHLDPQKQHEILTELGQEIVRSLPDTWTEIAYTARAIVSYREELMLVRHDDGRSERADIPIGTTLKLGELRRGMYQEGKGTWFSMKITVTRPGKFTTEFDYDNEPGFLFHSGDGDYVRELRQFPRDEEHVPAWLREKVRARPGAKSEGRATG